MDGADRASARPRLIVAGNANVDLLLGPIEPWPRVGTEVIAERLVWRVGGALGNSALALAGLGVAARLVWDVGDDPLGSWLQARLEATGSEPRVLPAATSVTVGVTHPDGERTFLSHLGHLAASDPEALARSIASASPGDHLLVGGSFLLPRWRPALPTLLARARTRSVVTALDTGWPSGGWNQAVRSELLATLAHVDLFLPNLDEARGLLGAPEASPHGALRALRPLVAGTTVLKLGSAGACRLDRRRVDHVPAPQVAVVDTVGAGDTFNAALLAARVAGLDWHAALEAAVMVASQAIATSPRRYLAWDDLRRLVGGSAASTGLS